MIYFTIKGLPPSYNKHCKINYNLRQVYLTDEARLFKQRVKMSMPSIKVDKDVLFNVRITYCANWYYKNGRLRRIDIQNMDKLLIDAMFEKIGIDDSHLWILEQNKRQDVEDDKT